MAIDAKVKVSYPNDRFLCPGRGFFAPERQYSIEEEFECLQML